MYSRMFGRLIVIAAVSAVASGYAKYANQIPNGNSVPNPCGEGVWKGVGHLAIGGMGERNAFGIDFGNASHVWRDVCGLDSDKDGKTNGEELGDPDCVLINTTTSRFPATSHPGFCDPVDGAACMNNPNKPHCENQVFDCRATQAAEVRSRTLRFPKTKIPPTETNYYCMTFDLEHDQDYHMIATKPEIDNVDVMHHITLYGCSDEASSMSTPTSCGMSTRYCQQLIGLWSVGVIGECLYKDAGFRIGKTGYKRLLLEFHWNNPDMLNNLEDSSGMTIYYTPQLRKYDAGIFMTGERHLVIPPRREEVVFNAVCPAECTRNLLKDTIYFTQGFNHMHYRGVLQRVVQTSGGVPSDLTYEPDWNYDTPKKFVYDPPVTMNPGDTLQTTCVFQSLKDDKTVYFGESTNDEMCFGLFTYFPKENLRTDECVSDGTFLQCKMTNETHYGDCNMAIFFNRNHTETRGIMNPVIDKCHGTCTEECREAINVAKYHPCLSHENIEWALRYTARGKETMAQLFVAAMDDCDWVYPSAAAALQTAVSSLIVAAVTVRLLL